VGKYVVDAGVVLHLLREGIEVPAEHQLLAPTLIRSQVLDALYKQFRQGKLSPEEGKDLLARFSEMKIRYLGDKVLRSVAWKVADELGWDSTERAEYLALTQLQADAFITLDKRLAKSAAEVVKVEDFGALL
jgi:predicted nucleic acid-binding protein